VPDAAGQLVLDSIIAVFLVDILHRAGDLHALVAGEAVAGGAVQEGRGLEADFIADL